MHITLLNYDIINLYINNFIVPTYVLSRVDNRETIFPLGIIILVLFLCNNWYTKVAFIVVVY